MHVTKKQCIRRALLIHFISFHSSDQPIKETSTLNDDYKYDARDGGNIIISFFSFQVINAMFKIARRIWGKQCKLQVLKC